MNRAGVNRFPIDDHQARNLIGTGFVSEIQAAEHQMGGSGADVDSNAED